MAPDVAARGRRGRSRPRAARRGSSGVADSRAAKRGAVEGSDVISHLDLSYRRVLVSFRRPAVGAGISDASATLTVAAIANVATDPDRRGEGHATGLVELAHREAADHGMIRFAALFAGPTVRGFYERLGYRHPAGAADEDFLVCPLGDEEWPDGTVDTRGRW